MSSTSAARHHLLIAGAGRSGTSILVRLLTECGLSTELSNNPEAQFDLSANAGAESFPLSPGHHPYVVKSPWAYQYIKQLLDSPDVVIDEILIPIRRLSDAASSRIVQEFKQQHKLIPDLIHLEDTWTNWGTTAGGVNYSLEPLDQARILAHSLHVLIENAEEREIPYRFLSFPRFLRDADYLYRRIKHILRPDLGSKEFCEIVSRVYDEKSVRIEQELADECNDALPSSVTNELPSAGSLEKIAMKRELFELRTRVSALEALFAEPKITNPNNAKTGLFAGDFALHESVHHGWHFITVLRPNSTVFGAQIALSDTHHRILYRIKFNSTWSLWRPVMLGEGEF